MDFTIAAVPFPPGAAPTWQFWATHLAVVVLAVGAVAGALLRSVRPPRAIDLLVWLLLIPTGGLIFVVSPVGDLVDDRFRRSVTAFVGSVALSGLIITAVRLPQKRPGPRLTLAAGCLVFFALLTLVVLPATPTANATARRVHCGNNLKQIWLGLENSVDVHKALPEAVANADAAPRSWRVDLLPYIDGAPLQKAYDDSALWDSPANRPIARTLVPVLVCPSNLRAKSDDGDWYTAYAAVTGSQSAFSDQARSGFPATIADGASYTLLVLEACGQEIVWTEPRDVDPSKQTIGINLDGDRAGFSPAIGSSYHPGGTQALMADGHVKLFSETIDPKVLAALTTYNGGETVDEF
jgi:prepilin-type processing-associated H-X9-DG protein